MDCSFDARDADEVPELKRFLQKAQNPSEKVLKDILKSKTNGHRPDSEQFDQIGGFEGWSDNGERDQETQDQDARLNQASHQLCDSLMSPLALYPARRARLAPNRKKQKRKKIRTARRRFGRSEIVSLMILTPEFHALEKSIGMRPSIKN